ncbi:hypothetical protein [Formosa sp. 4Alg 33]|uniref:hypothetical protein n=1 Tax=Formosa sp. 4Alg 33 TaxID=3382189 RepID=UPI003D9C684D
MIKHHNYYKVHLPNKQYSGESVDELAEILMEEAHLASNGKWTKNYTAKNPKTDQFEISLYPSILYATNKLDYSENEKFQTINNFLDNQFVDFLERFNPLYKCTSFIEYHLNYFKGDKTEFCKHIKYQILFVVQKRKKLKKKDFDYESLEQILIDWVNEKMIIKEEKKSILNAETVIINNKSKIKKQSIGNQKELKESNWNKANVIITLIVGIVTVIGIVWGIMS